MMSLHNPRKIILDQNVDIAIPSDSQAEIIFHCPYVKQEKYGFFNMGSWPFRIKEANMLARKSARTPLAGGNSSCGIDKNTYNKEFLEKEKAEREKLLHNHPE